MAQVVGGKIFIKLVIAVAGDRIVISGDVVEINGKPLERERVPIESLEAIRDHIDRDVFYETQSGVRYLVMLGGDDAGQSETAQPPTDLVVPRRCVFVMGDNRSRSRGSRQFAPIHVGDVIGYVDYLYWPAANWSRFGVYRD